MKKFSLLLIYALFAAACAAPSARKTVSLTEQLTSDAARRPAAQAAGKRTKLPPPSVMTEDKRPAAPARQTPRRYRALPLPKEMRGAWIASVENIDWPSKPGLPSDQQKKEFTDLLDTLKKLNFNTVVVQVRPAADTFWPSENEPWSYYLTGKQGHAPEPYYDPLSFMITEAHKRGLAFHAWFNPYRVQNSSKAVLCKNHPANLHPDWIVSYGGKKYYNPAVPQARRHAVNVIMETVRHYNIDAVHLDDYFYPYPVQKDKKNVPFPDAAEYKKYGNGMPLADWRRNNVNLFVQELSREIRQEKPDVAFGISPFGVWRNKSKDPTGSATRAFSAYDDGLYADSRLWITEGWIDYVVPQLYWHNAHRSAPYGVLLNWWSEEIKRNPGVKLYIGLGTYKHGAEWKDKTELANQLKMLEKTPNVSGAIHFSAIRIQQNQGSVQELLKKFYK